MAGGERVLGLRFVQPRNPEWVGRPFFARFHSRSTWFDDLRPAFDEREFFFEPEMHRLRRLRTRQHCVVVDLRRSHEPDPAA